MKNINNKKLKIIFLVLIFVIFFLIFESLFKESRSIQLPNIIENVTLSENQKTKCDDVFYLPKNASRMLNDLVSLLNISLSPEELNFKSNIIEKEIQPSYANGICNLTSFFITFNDSLQLNLNSNDIEKIKVKITDTKNKIYENVPENENIFSTSHIASYVFGQQSARYLIGNTSVIIIFVKYNNVWYSDEIDSVLNHVERATNWTKTQAPSSANVNFKLGYYVVSVDTDPTDGECNSWMEEAVKNLGFSDDNGDSHYTDELTNYVKNLWNTNNSIIIFSVHNSPIIGLVAGYACPYPYFGYGERTAIYYNLCFILCWENGDDTYAHENMHLYGSCDEYLGCSGMQANCTTYCPISFTPTRNEYSNTNCIDCNPLGEPCIMRGIFGLGAGVPEWNVCYYTRGQIGWGDFDGDAILDPLDSCPYECGPEENNGCHAEITKTIVNNYSVDIITKLSGMCLLYKYGIISDREFPPSNLCYSHSYPINSSHVKIVDEDGKIIDLITHDNCADCNVMPICPVDKNFVEVTYNQIQLNQGECINTTTGTQICWKNASMVSISQFPITSITTTTSTTTTTTTTSTTTTTIPTKFLTINSPENETYGIKLIPLNVTASEKFDLIEYSDNGERFGSLCRDCQSYNRRRNFNDGQHNLTVRGIDYDTNYSDSVLFFVDSKKPVISYTYFRRNSYVNGTFPIKYHEEYLKNITLNYSNNYFTKFDCPSGRNKECIFEVDLSAYEGQEIEYNFIVCDSVRCVSSRLYSVKVDTIAPGIEIFRPTEEAVYARYVPINISLTERTNLKYSDNGGRFSTLCSRCNSYDRTKYFSRGYHNVTFMAVDEADNENYKSVTFNVEY